MAVLNMYCEQCKTNTPHVESKVADLESATVWHCLYCGNERRPKGGNAPVLA